MDKIKFIFDETGEEVLFTILGSVKKDDHTYLMAVDESEFESDDMTAYILKETKEIGDDVIYEIVDDDEILQSLSVMFEEVLDNYDIER